MISLAKLVMRQGRPTWFYKRVLRSNPLGRYVFFWAFRREHRLRRIVLQQLYTTEIPRATMPQRYPLENYK